MIATLANYLENIRSDISENVLKGENSIGIGNTENEDAIQIDRDENTGPSKIGSRITQMQRESRIVSSSRPGDVSKRFQMVCKYSSE